MNSKLATNNFVEHETLNSTSNLDSLIFDDEAFSLTLHQQVELRDRYVRAAFAHHLKNCAEYAVFARRLGANKTDLPVGQIPVIPTSAFKAQSLLSVPKQEIAKFCLSSGTRGIQSCVARDRISLERLLGSVRAGISLIESWHEDEVEVLHLGSERKEAGDIWFPYVMSLIELLHPTHHFVRDGTFDVHSAAEMLNSILKRSENHVAVVGPPFRVMELVHHLSSIGGCIGGDDVTVVTGGGWKRFAGAEIPRDEFRKQVRDAFGMSSESQVRDTFNQVELNTVFMECASHRKHVPPWVYARTRDPETLAVQPNGEEGLLSYIDASATSYPAMIVTDDVGTVFEGRCSCGREGTTIEVSRRLNRSAARGCSLALDATAAGSHQLQRQAM